MVLFANIPNWKDYQHEFSPLNCHAWCVQMPTNKIVLGKYLPITVPYVKCIINDKNKIISIRIVHTLEQKKLSTITGCAEQLEDEKKPCLTFGSSCNNIMLQQISNMCLQQQHTIPVEQIIALPTDAYGYRAVDHLLQAGCVELATNIVLCSTTAQADIVKPQNTVLSFHTLHWALQQKAWKVVNHIVQLKPHLLNYSGHLGVDTPLEYAFDFVAKELQAYDSKPYFSNVLKQQLARYLCWDFDTTPTAYNTNNPCLTVVNEQFKHGNVNTTITLDIPLEANTPIYTCKLVVWCRIIRSPQKQLAKKEYTCNIIECNNNSVKISANINYNLDDIRNQFVNGEYVCLQFRLMHDDQCLKELISNTVRITTTWRLKQEYVDDDMQIADEDEDGLSWDSMVGKYEYQEIEPIIKPQERRFTDFMTIVNSFTNPLVCREWFLNINLTNFLEKLKKSGVECIIIDVFALDAIVIQQLTSLRTIKGITVQHRARLVTESNHLLLSDETKSYVSNTLKGLVFHDITYLCLNTLAITDFVIQSWSTSIRRCYQHFMSRGRIQLLSAEESLKKLEILHVTLSENAIVEFVMRFKVLQDLTINYELSEESLKKLKQLPLKKLTLLHSSPRVAIQALFSSEWQHLQLFTLFTGTAFNDISVDACSAIVNSCTSVKKLYSDCPVHVKALHILITMPTLQIRIACCKRIST